MPKKITLIAFCLLCHFTYAEMCPDSQHLKNQLPIGWQLYDSDNGTLLTHAQQARFFHQAAHFALAEWSNNKTKNNGIHCYYNDKTGSHLQAYLANKNFVPHISKASYWYPVTGFMHCAASTDKCEFQPYIQPHSQLAKRLQLNKPTKLS